MQLEKPLFLTNSEWYYYDDIKLIYILTKKAPPEAVLSYQEFYSKVNKPYSILKS